MSKTRPAALALAALVAAFGLTACGQDRWCEHDATDTKVSDRFCKNGTPGYEWETDGGHGHKTNHKKTKSKTSKTKSHR
ncbi:hypothetical protein [Actinomadura bangladeshensis]|uniref:Lipoprotein n=1 Tax=Actinomadura bangladeshensis TaxID=453573 RepID=A0A4V2XP03_9ACTN|nr:hypothetical protein [Actinomadura bangladeshensis]TDC20226.1 hypothetical protein E1284_01120 [Actinomadura bangladeshensis]